MTQTQEEKRKPERHQSVIGGAGSGGTTRSDMRLQGAAEVKKEEGKKRKKSEPTGIPRHTATSEPDTIYHQTPPEKSRSRTRDILATNA